MLEAERSTDEAVAGIVANPALHAEAKALLPILKARTAAAGIDGVAHVIVRRFATFPQPDRTPEEWEAWWEDYYDALSDMPIDALEAAMKAYIRSPGAEFMPKPAKLRELASKVGSTAIKAYTRAKLAAAQEPRRLMDPVSVAERKALVAEALQAIGAKRVEVSE